MRAVLAGVTAVATSAILATAALGVVDDGDSRSSSITTKSFHARATSFVEIDQGRPGESAGDLFTFTHSLADPTTGRRVGRTQGHCVRIVRARTSDCVMTAFLGGGQILVSGAFRESSRNRLAIVAGTNLYVRTGGWLDVRRAGLFELDLTYELRSR